MSFLQQIQSIPSQSKWIGESPYRKALAVGAILLIETICLIAGNAFTLIGTTALFIGMAVYLKDRWVTRLVAAALTVILIAVSAAALFPAYAPIALGIGGTLAGLIFVYCLYRVIAKS